MLVVQAADDTRVRKDQGINMAKRLRRLEKPVEYVEIDTGGHSMRDVRGREIILTSLAAFLAQHIDPERVAAR